jgi:hypothetical protein
MLQVTPNIKNMYQNDFVSYQKWFLTSAVSLKNIM